MARLSDSHIAEVPRHNSNDFNPMWIGTKIYFLSDRNGPATLFSYDPTTKHVSQLIDNRGLDILSASAGPGCIVYEQLGSLHLYHLVSGKTTEVKVHLNADFPELHPHQASVSHALRNAHLSPNGDRAIFEARGEILTVDTRSGEARNLTNSPGVREQDPAWSPDGKTVAYFSDESGEYALHLRPVVGNSQIEKIDLGDPPSFYYSPRWSPDGKKIAYIDKRQNIWYVDRSKKAPLKVDTDLFFDYFSSFSPVTDIAPVWSPDGQWLAYAKHLKSGFGAIFLYSLHAGHSTQVTDAMIDAAHPIFAPSGNYLYFTAAANSTRPGTRGVYAISLQKDAPLRFSYEAIDDRAHSQEVSTEQLHPAAGTFSVDLEGIGERIRALPAPAKNYAGLAAAADSLFLLEAASDSLFGPPGLNVLKLDLRTGQIVPFIAGVSDLDISADGKKMLFQQGERWTVCSTDAPPKAGEGLLPTGTLEVRVDPRAEWRQMYHEVWRLLRDYFYDPGLHGLDLKATEAIYAPYIEGLATRSDLNYLFMQMLAGLAVSHLAIYGGDMPQITPEQVGLLGADYTVENGRYRFARIYTADPWNPDMKAPLAAPAAQVKAGEYLLAVNGQALNARDNLYRLFVGTTGKPTIIQVGRNPNGAGARDLTVTPIANELLLRHRAWIEANRRRVTEATHGRVAYVDVPHTLDFDSVDHDLAAQGDKEAVIIDERFDQGGDLPGAFVDRLVHPLMMMGTGRESPDGAIPAKIYGPKVLLINEYAGSGGDALALYFRRQNAGPIIGKRTWGGLTAAFGTPDLIDGGTVEIPSVALWSSNGAWEVENHGVAPDLEVEFDPEQVRKGYDPQLEQAISTILRLLSDRPFHLPKRPAFPNYYTISIRKQPGREKR